MRELAVCLCGVSFIAAIALAMVPNGALKKYAELAAALVFIAVIASFLTSAPDMPSISLPDAEIEDKTDEMAQMIVEETRIGVQDRIRDAVAERFSVAPECLDVCAEMRFENGEVTLEGISVTVTGEENMFTVSRIEYWLSETFLCRVTAEFCE